MGETKAMKDKIASTEILEMYDFDNSPRGSLLGVDLSKEMVKVRMGGGKRSSGVHFFDHLLLLTSLATSDCNREELLHICYPLRLR